MQTKLAALCVERDASEASPIDDFYEYLTLLIPLGKVEPLTENDALGRALLLGLVSATELYFRQILATIVNVCPTTRAHASRHQVALGAVDYYGDEVGLGLMDGVSFSTSGEIRKQTQRIAGIELPGGSSVDQAVKEFERLCELRHAATHARGNLGHQNLRDLDIEFKGRRFALRVHLDGFHESARICQNVVRAYNRFLFRRTIERWIGNGVLRADWAADKPRFVPLFLAFRSVHDGVGPDSPYRAYLSLRPTLQSAAAKSTVGIAPSPLPK